MNIEQIRPLANPFLTKENEVVTKDNQFQSIFTDLIKETQNEQVRSRELFNNFTNGGDVEIHEMMISSEKAKTSLQLLMELRNKTVDMYKELIRTPV